VHENKKMLSEGEAKTYPDLSSERQQKPTLIIYTTEKHLKHGGLLQKWHRLAASEARMRDIPLNPLEIEAHHLILCWDEGPAGMRFDLCAAWFRHLPARLGRNRALDDATRLLSTVHKIMLSEADPAQWVCPASYIRALRSLRKTLSHPVHGCSVETLAAAMIMYHIEVSAEQI
jgi:hypothetical protein